MLFRVRRAVLWSPAIQTLLALAASLSTRAIPHHFKGLGAISSATVTGIFISIWRRRLQRKERLLELYRRGHLCLSSRFRPDPET